MSDLEEKLDNMSEIEFKEYLLEDRELCALIAHAQFIAMQYKRTKEEWDDLCDKSWKAGKNCGL